MQIPITIPWNSSQVIGEESRDDSVAPSPCLCPPANAETQHDIKFIPSRRSSVECFTCGICVGRACTDLRRGRTLQQPPSPVWRTVATSSTGSRWALSNMVGGPRLVSDRAVRLLREPHQVQIVRVPVANNILSYRSIRSWYVSGPAPCSCLSSRAQHVAQLAQCCERRRTVNDQAVQHADSERAIRTMAGKCTDAHLHSNSNRE